MNDIEKNRVTEILTLHEDVTGYLRMSLEKAMRIGELLTEQKTGLKHGEFTPWIKANLPFTDRTARNYMAIYSNRNLLKSETVSVLSSAYRLLEGRAEEPKALEPGDPGYWEQEQLRHRQRWHKITDLKCDLEVAKTIPELKRIRDQAAVIQREVARDVLDAEVRMGEILNEIKAQIPEYKKMKAVALASIEKCNAILAEEAGPLPNDIRADIERLSGDWQDVLNHLEYGLALVA